MSNSIEAAFYTTPGAPLHPVVEALKRGAGGPGAGWVSQWSADGAEPLQAAWLATNNAVLLAHFLHLTDREALRRALTRIADPQGPLVEALARSLHLYEVDEDEETPELDEESLAEQRESALEYFQAEFQGPLEETAEGALAGDFEAVTGAFDLILAYAEGGQWKALHDALSATLREEARLPTLEALFPGLAG